MSKTINTAHTQWKTRPDEERFFTVAEAYQAMSLLRGRSHELALGRFHVESEGDGLFLHSNTWRGEGSRLNHWSFGQLAQRAFPGCSSAGLLRQLPASLAAENLRVGLSQRLEAGIESKALLTLDENGAEVRALTSEGYARAWNAEVLAPLVALENRGEWRAPPARPVRSDQARTRLATEADVLRNASHPSLGIKVGDPIAPGSVFASDRDMFVCLVDDSKRIEAPGCPNGLSRFFLRWNSEVGDRTNGGMFGLMDSVCGNLILWGVKEAVEFSFKHTSRGNNAKAELEFKRRVDAFGDRPESHFQRQIEAAMAYSLGKSREDVIDNVFRRKLPALTKTNIGAAYDVAVDAQRYGDPGTVWGMVNGLTEVSQRERHTGDRFDLDRAAGKLLESVL